MKAKTEEFLYLFLWSADMAMRPTFRNLTDSFESWAYRKGLLKQLHRLEKQRLLERDARHSEDRLYRLTAAGRLHALGGRDPEERWARAWDGSWRLVIFDVPCERDIERDRLRRYLRSKWFGYLQKSVWITPDPLEDEVAILGKGKINVESLVLLEARGCAGESDASIVQGAWEFDEINRCYERHLEILDRRPEGPLRTRAASNALARWAAAEREAWAEALSKDPLLPVRLLPPNYLGRQAWLKRVQVFQKAAAQLQTFELMDAWDKPDRCALSETVLTRR
ncbi:MAG TPA: hypothetical protein GYA07_13200 [Verrucomicrobia bacterium]|nr:hypothetical protein [Verrucomicrobiota bacterium]HOP96443.1 PaaX family transcriptional regulator C-terminal domain-containing protein [Verrucomicrobiota bacterium]